MSIHSIPQNIDIPLAYNLIQKYIPNHTISYDGNSPNPPTEFEILPDLTTQESSVLTKIFQYAKADYDFNNLPNWADWDSDTASTYVYDNVMNGFEQADVDTYIAGLPNTVAGMKTGLTQIAYAIVDIRNILSQMAKAIIYIRDILIRIR